MEEFSQILNGMIGLVKGLGRWLINLVRIAPNYIVGIIVFLVAMLFLSTLLVMTKTRNVIKSPKIKTNQKVKDKSIEVLEVKRSEVFNIYELASVVRHNNTTIFDKYYNQVSKVGEFTAATYHIGGADIHLLGVYNMYAIYTLCAVLINLAVLNKKHIENIYTTEPLKELASNYADNVIVVSDTIGLDTRLYEKMLEEVTQNVDYT